MRNEINLEAFYLDFSVYAFKYFSLGHLCILTVSGKTLCQQKPICIIFYDQKIVTN